MVQTIFVGKGWRWGTSRSTRDCMNWRIIQKLNEIMREDQLLTIWMIAYMMNINKETVKQILHVKTWPKCLQKWPWKSPSGTKGQPKAHLFLYHRSKTEGMKKCIGSICLPFARNRYYKIVDEFTKLLVIILPLINTATFLTVLRIFTNYSNLVLTLL